MKRQLSTVIGQPIHDWVMVTRASKSRLLVKLVAFVPGYVFGVFVLKSGGLGGGIGGGCLGIAQAVMTDWRYVTRSEQGLSLVGCSRGWAKPKQVVCSLLVSDIEFGPAKRLSQQVKLAGDTYAMSVTQKPKLEALLQT